MLDINAALNAKLLAKMAHCVVSAVGDTGATDDIVGDAVVRILANLETFDSERGSFDSWACRIASNVARNWRKAHANRNHDSEDTSDDDSATAPLVDTLGPDVAKHGSFVGPDGRADIERKADAEMLALALDALEADERTYILAVNDGMGKSEAGALVGWSPATATRRHRAIAAKVARVI